MGSILAVGLTTGDDGFRLEVIPARLCLLRIDFYVLFVHLLYLVGSGANHASLSSSNG